ncbi:unnamed protein product [Porites evermanni]|uniref:Uncharacterized protein n=1 Tax=Porites evermanni TaxID=104178 RepID=A0ABN8PGA5_9CNID|nr:unnamed protein product [Porites evermanni]
MSTGGRWLLEETPYHINCLKFLAGSLAIMSFTKNKAKAQEQLLMDNISAVTYINKMGGTHSPMLSYLAKNLRDWCLTHNISVTTRYIPGVQNVEAVRESRVFLDSSDWKLNPGVFNRLYQKWGLLNIDLCLPSLLPTRSVCKLASRPSSNSHGCIHPGLGDLLGLRLSSICSDRLMPSPNSESAGVTHGVGSTGLASSTLVSTTIRAVHRLPSPPTSSGRSTDPGKQNPPSQTPTVSWLAPVSRGYQTADISAQSQC